jgi:acyl-CoA dehydrogenase
MDFALTPMQEEIRTNVGRIMRRFGDDYWLARDRDGEFPVEFTQAMAEGGWLGIAMPERYGGAGLGVSDAAVLMHTVAKSPGAMSAASAIHINIFGPNPIVVFGSEEQRERWLPPLIRGETRTCFGVTEPTAGLNTSNIQTRAVRDGDQYLVSGQKTWTSTAREADKILLLARTTPREECARPFDGISLFFTDLDRDHAEVREIEKMGRHAVDSNEVFFDEMPVPAGDRIGEEGKGFSTCSTASTRSASSSPPRRLASAKKRSTGLRPTRSSASCSTGPSARTSPSSTRWLRAGPSYRRPG